MSSDTEPEKNIECQLILNLKQRQSVNWWYWTWNKYRMSTDTEPETNTECQLILNLKQIQNVNWYWTWNKIRVIKGIIMLLIPTFYNIKHWTLNLSGYKELYIFNILFLLWVMVFKYPIKTSFSKTNILFSIDLKQKFFYSKNRLKYDYSWLLSFLSKNHFSFPLDSLIFFWWNADLFLPGNPFPRF